MFVPARHPYASLYQSCNPYEQLLLQQELQRRRNAEAYRRRQLEIEELNRQYECAHRQVELQRRRQMAMEQDAWRGGLSGQTRDCGYSMRDGESHDLFETLYGTRLGSTSPCGRRRTQAEHMGDPQERATSGQIHVDTSDALDQRTNSPIEPSEPSATPTLTSPTEPEIDEPTEIEIEGVNTDASHAAVSGILATFASLSSSFTFPSRLEFISTASSDSPKLAYTPSNAPIHQYEHVLTGLLTQLDAVESYGDDEVRRARKEAVRRIEEELEGLDRRKLEKWKRQSPRAVEPGAESQLEVDGSTTEVDPLQVPLPQDEEDEHMDDATAQSPVAILVTTPLSLSRHPLALSPRATEPNLTLLTEASASETSDSGVGEYVDVGFTTDEETEEVERIGDLGAMDEWDMDF